MQNRVSRDVCRLILRYIRTPYDVRGLLGANRFWRETVVAYFEVYSRKALCVFARVPQDHTLSVITHQVAHAPATAVVCLDVLWTALGILNTDMVRRHGLYTQEAGPIDKATAAVKTRQDQVDARIWGEGRKSVNALSDEDWTRQMLQRALNKLSKLRKEHPDVDKLHREWQTFQKKHERLRALVMSYYEPQGAICSWKPTSQDARFLAEYPQLHRDSKKRVRETDRTHNAALDDERALTTKYARLRFVTK